MSVSALVTIVLSLFSVGLTKRTAGVTIFNSDDDQSTIHESVRIIRDRVDGINYKEFHNYGHFCVEDMNTVEFPELLTTALSSAVTERTTVA